MSLLREIQAALLEERSKIGPILLKLRFLASRLGSDTLEEWVRHESDGYPTDVDVPDYREIEVSYRGTWAGPYSSGVKNARIPPQLIEKFANKSWTQQKMRHSIATIDAMRGDSKGGGTLEMDASDLILVLQGKVYPGWVCQDVTGHIPEAAIEALLSAVRSRILELTIQLEREIPTAAEITSGSIQKVPPAEDSDAVTQVFQQTIYGNQTTIHSTGDAARIDVNVVQGDIDSLTRSLIVGGIDEADAKELAAIIASEEPESAEEPLGARAKEWLTRYMGKAAGGTLKAGMAIATAVASAAALKFWGL